MFHCLSQLLLYFSDCLLFFSIIDKFSKNSHKNVLQTSYHEIFLHYNKVFRYILDYIKRTTIYMGDSVNIICQMICLEFYRLGPLFCNTLENLRLCLVIMR